MNTRHLIFQMRFLTFWYFTIIFHNYFRQISSSSAFIAPGLPAAQLVEPDSQRSNPAGCFFGCIRIRIRMSFRPKRRTTHENSMLMFSGIFVERKCTWPVWFSTVLMYYVNFLGNWSNNRKKIIESPRWLRRPVSRHVCFRIRIRGSLSPKNIEKIRVNGICSSSTVL